MENHVSLKVVSPALYYAIQDLRAHTNNFLKNQKMKPLSPGHYIIQPSANSKVRSLITKQQHPRKVTLPCNCHFTIHHECNRGFSHRGTYYSPSGNKFRGIRECTESTVYETPMVREIRANLSTEDTNPIQLQPPESVESSQVLDRANDNRIEQDIDWTPFLEGLEKETRDILG
ncbi:pathogenicity determinant [Beet curly top virus - California [Logan/Arabidopsis]]|uniref:Protein C2 n=1 Tax=Beet curly top virus (strain California/Logan) TaxID=268960 RepID=C2_BCTVC|nr:RecName: Full=Protein C2; AltName: Full=Protein L2 [Beet curly top virus - California [Logan]]AAK59261.1 pathogenicity determinant [Beet curly top virus - California [Logan/Arabidopsis]]